MTANQRIVLTSVPEVKERHCLVRVHAVGLCRVCRSQAIRQRRVRHHKQSNRRVHHTIYQRHLKPTGNEGLLVQWTNLPKSPLNCV